jgi:transposase
MRRSARPSRCITAFGFSPASISHEACVRRIWQAVGLNGMPLSATARAGLHPKVVLEACYGWYWAADTLAAPDAEVHLAHPLGVKAFSHRRVKNDELDACDLADLLRMGRLPEA